MPPVTAARAPDFQTPLDSGTVPGWALPYGDAKPNAGLDCGAGKRDWHWHGAGRKPLPALG